MEIKITSKIGKSYCQVSQLYQFLSDFANIKKILPPEQSSKFQAEHDRCSISVNNFAQLELSIVERETDKLIKISSEDKKESMTVWVQFKPMGPYDTRLRITIQTKVNLVTKWAMKKQMQKMADSFVEGLCQIPAQVLAQAL